MSTLMEIAVKAMSQAKFDPIGAAKFMQAGDAGELGDISRYYVETLAAIAKQVDIELPELTEERREAEICRRIYGVTELS
jgi:hypothetical protein